MYKRQGGYRCELDYAKTALKPQFRLADRAGAGAIVIIGEEERKNNVLTVKNAKTKNPVSYTHLISSKKKKP